MSKIIDKILADPRVDAISDERGSGEGFWVYTTSFCMDSMPSGHEESACLHTIHEDSPTECYKRLREVIPCDCFRCTSQAERRARK